MMTDPERQQLLLARGQVRPAADVEAEGAMMRWPSVLEARTVADIWPQGQTADVRKLLDFIEALVAEAIADPNTNSKRLAESFENLVVR